MTYQAGDWVRVRSSEEILRTLDSEGRLEKLPFMPEMLRYCGQKFRIQAIAHKTCDTVLNQGGRRMHRSVHLQELRCDGSAHGGCQAACLLFWKEDWLQPSSADGSPIQEHAPGASAFQELARHAQTGTGSPGPTVYSCQATRLLEATEFLPWWDVRQYVRDVATGNVPFRRTLRVLVLGSLNALGRIGFGYRLARRLYDVVHRVLTGRPAPGDVTPLPPGMATPSAELGLKPGEWVRVRPYKEIQKTLNASHKNRGLWFDDEMVQHCGEKFRVLGRVDRIINEKSGEMMQFQNPCVVLDGVNCTGSYTPQRLLCPRSVVTYWREIWLDRVQGEAPGGRRASAPGA